MTAPAAGLALHRSPSSSARQAHARDDAALDAAGPVAGTAAPTLAVRGLTTEFKLADRWQPVVQDVSFEIHPSETVAIVGESGSGKSVTALSIMRLIDPRFGKVSGSVRFGGKELLTLTEAAMQRVRGNDIGMIFQEPMTSLNPVLTIGYQISESLISHRGMSRAQARAEAIRLLDRVRIPAAAARFGDYPHRFSGGMRQRAMIAMALACRPALLIADEPTTALDVTIQAQILDLIKELQQEAQTAVLFITHDMGVVAEVADRTIVMYRGRHIEANATTTLFTAPGQPYTRALLAAIPRLGDMAAHATPLPFPVVDPETGQAGTDTARQDTVDRIARPILDVQAVCTRFDTRAGFFGRVRGRVHAVEGVSFTLQPGETLGLVGESGCGKSTIGRSIVGLNTPTSGSVLIDGLDVHRVDADTLRALRKRVQIIFQDPFASLNPRQTVGASIAEPLVAHGLQTRRHVAARVSELLENVGLNPDMAHRYPHEFSGGQRQRLCIARALGLEPGLIVADESVSALDVSIKAQVVNLMLDLQARMGLAYVFISHDIAIVERVAHRVAVMYLGEIVEIGPRRAVFENPQHPYTQRLMAAVPVPDPSRRYHRRPPSRDEIRNPLRPLDYAPPQRTYREVSPGHCVQVWDDEWNLQAR